MSNYRDLQLKHLDITQDAINRLAQNSFVVKGWSITIVSAIFALVETTDANRFSLVIALIPVLIFWGFDAYYLRQERLYRCLYRTIASDLNKETDPPQVTPLDMNTKPYNDETKSWLKTLFSKTVWPIPITVILLISVYLYLGPIPLAVTTTP